MEYGSQQESETYYLNLVLIKLLHFDQYGKSLDTVVDLKASYLHLLGASLRGKLKICYQVPLLKGVI
jgi:hypothetical protein